MKRIGSLSTGCIVYLMSHKIAPQSRLRRHWAAVLGVAVSLLAEQWLGGIG